MIYVEKITLGPLTVKSVERSKNTLSLVNYRSLYMANYT